MVNNGPSKGCRLCRARKIKCDEAMPSCLRCSRSGYSCPGYETFRDQTQVVQRKSNGSQSRHIQDGPNGQLNGYEIHITEQALIGTEQSLIPALSQNPDENAVSFFVGHFIPLVPGYFLDQLAPTVRNAPEASALQAATRATSLNFLALHPHHKHLRPMAATKYTEAMRRLRRELRNVDCVNSDETLMAILLLGTFEHSKYLANGPDEGILHLSVHHTKGALALIKSRPRARFTSKVALALLLQSRSEMTYYAHLRSDPSLMDDIPKVTDFDFPEEALQTVGNFFNELADLIQSQIAFRGRALEVLFTQRHLVGLSEVEALLQDALQEDSFLKAWTPGGDGQTYPVHTIWRTAEDLEQQSFPPKLLYCDDVVRMGNFNGWRIARILQLHMLIQIYHLLRTRFGRPMWEEEKAAVAAIDELAEDICASVPYYLGWMNLGTDKNPSAPNNIVISRPSRLSDPEMIANWSQFMSILWCTCSLSCIADGKRRWLRAYLLAFSDGRADVFDISYFDHDDPFG